MKALPHPDRRPGFPKSKRPQSPGLLAALVAGALFGWVGCGLTGCKGRESAEGDVSRRPPEVAARPPRPAPRPDDYIGSAACASCHAEIYAQYLGHPMGQSLAPVSEASPIESYPSGEIEIPGPRRYRVDVADGAVSHHEYLLDAEGEMLYDQGEEVEYALGSGQRGRAYLINQDGRLYQSPLGWYSHAARWDLSPGYHPESHRRFQRRIGDGCLYCHAGQVAATAIEDRYDPPIFHEASIGCERCHGPAAAHVAWHEEGNAGLASEDPVVNPAKLEVSRRESVCNQCHLQGQYVIRRYGRGFFDFRPGDRLEDVFVCLVAENRLDDQGRERVVSQVEQMRESRCYVGSQQALGCISCHDPHRHVGPEQRVEYYRDRCIDCHADQGCALPESDQQAPPARGSCIHCHMPALPNTDVPHTAQTDHRIPRRPSEGGPMAAGSRRPEAWQPFDGAAERLPAWEVARARGIAMMTEAWNRQDRELAAQAYRYLVPPGAAEAELEVILTALGEDTPVLAELAASYLLTGATAHAQRCWQHLLELEPENESAWSGLALLAQQQGDTEALETAVVRLLAIDPHHPQWHLMHARVLWQRGARSRALAASQQALEKDPTLTDVRRWIADAYRGLDRPAEGAAQEELARRIEAALRRSPARSRPDAEPHEPGAASASSR